MNNSLPILNFDQVSFSRSTPDFTRPILTDISWSVVPQQIAAVLGANGSGKSTLLRLAAAYLWPQKGSIQLLGQTLGTVPVAPLRARIGIVESNTIYPFDDDMTALDVAVSGFFSSLTIGYIHPTSEQWCHARQLLQHLGLHKQTTQLYFTLSTGERMRCLLARALVRKPDLLILDEPTAGLDLPARETLLATLAHLHQQCGKGIETNAASPPAIITVTHHLEELLPDTQNILLLSHDGRGIVAGPPESVLTDANLSAAYNIPIHIARRDRRYHAHIDPAAWSQLL